MVAIQGHIVVSSDGPALTRLELTIHMAVMDMVIFRTIFFELFSFLHVHAPYSLSRLLMNLGNTPRRRQQVLLFVRPIDSGTTKPKHKYYC